MWLQDYVIKWLPIVFGSKFYPRMKIHNIVVIVLNFDFEGEMNYLVPLCVHERECASKRYETKIL
jgi:hypothetical protein